MPTDKYATAFHVDVSLDGSTFWTVAHRIDSAGQDSPEQMAISELAVYGTR
jgi:hypothetical protein